MKISYNWLKNYIPEIPDAEKLAEIFTFHVCEIESVDKLPSGDFVFDIKVLPDRAHDLLSHQGAARDIAGILGLPFNEVKYEVPVGEPTKLEIKIETDKCRRYMGRIVRNVTVGPSPEWMKNYLETLGQRSINNLVDATNIVMFDTGNPIHIFDLDKLESEKIIVRDAKDGEVITTLDNKEVKLSSLNMVITDDQDILAIAGAKGGKKAEVDENTKNIVIEVANFDPTSVRKTAKAINIYTDAVKRFENDLSPEVCSLAMLEISALIAENGNPERPRGVEWEEAVDVYPKKEEKKTLTFSLAKVSKILGLTITDVEVENILKNFKREYKKNEDIFEMVVPDTRPDLGSDEDMAEEIGRVIGYDKIKAELPIIKNTAKSDENFSKIMIARNKLLNDGYSEVINYAFCNSGEVEVLASASDKKFLRTNLSDGLRESLKLNQLNAPFLEIKEIKIFEIGTVFLKDREEMHVAYNEKKNIIEMNLDKFVAEKLSPEEHRNFLLEISESPRRRDSQGSSEETFPPQIFKPWSIYPFIARDVAVWMKEGESAEKLKIILKENGTDLLIKEPYLFDSFSKDGKTSYAFRLVFQSYNRTLTDNEVNDIMMKINQKISEHSDWQMR